MFAIFMLNLCY